MATSYQRGRTAEYRSKKWLENEGYLVVRSAGSHGPIDLVAIPADTTEEGYFATRCVQVIQVKAGYCNVGAELDRLAALPIAHVSRCLHVWKKGAHAPEVYHP